VAVIRLEQQVSGAASSVPLPPVPQDATNVTPTPSLRHNIWWAFHLHHHRITPHRRRHGSEDESEEGDFLPTYHKLDFPKFNGSGNPLPWVNRCEHYFRVRRTPDHKRPMHCSISWTMPNSGFIGWNSMGALLRGMSSFAYSTTALAHQ
jgi:hypothetical protein